MPKGIPNKRYTGEFKLTLYSYEDLQLQMKRYLRRSNRIPMSVLEWKSPLEKRREIEAARVSFSLRSGYALPPSEADAPT